MNDSEATTQGVVITVRSNFVSERSKPLEGSWFFAYRILVSNAGSVPVQLLNRHWVITDAHGNVEEVRGPGVVGEQPVIAPGKSFEYTSYCPLGTPFGTMEGSYEMITEAGDRFWAKIGKFELSEELPVN
jgi:ApaG protein